MGKQKKKKQNQRHNDDKSEERDDIYHAKELRELWQSLTKDEQNKIHPWMQIHYFQVKDHEQDKTNKRNRPLKTISLETEKEQIQHFFKRRKKSISALQTRYEMITCTGKLDDRLVSGFGKPDVKETSLSIHPLYGVPYLSASSIKGILRHWAESEVYESNSDEHPMIKKIFGSDDPQQRGSVIFLDAFPQNYDWKIEPDIMTVHYKEYYEGKSAPSDDLVPVPIPFYTVKDVNFDFHFFAKKADQDDLRLVKKWLHEALQEIGIAAKTTTGYGYFSFDQEDSSK